MATTRADGIHYDAREAAANLSSSLMIIAKIDNTGKLAVCGNGEYPHGVITEGSVAGKSTTVQTGGLAKVKAGAAVTAGAKVMSNGSGKAITAASAGSTILGIAMNTVLNADEILEVQIDRATLHA